MSMSAKTSKFAMARRRINLSHILLVAFAAHALINSVIVASAQSAGTGSALNSSQPSSVQVSHISPSPTLILLGAPGGGKSTISKKFLSHNFPCEKTIVHLSVGDLLRDQIRKKTALGLEAQKYTDDGKLAPEELVRRVLEQEIRTKDQSFSGVEVGGEINSELRSTSVHSDANVGSGRISQTNTQKTQTIFMLDGIPRTLEQASYLDSILRVESVIFLDVPDKEIVTRVSSRWVHMKSGRVYNYLFNPPKVEGVDDETGEKLERRPDDRPEIVGRRLEVFHENVKPILDYYSTASAFQPDHAGETRLSVFSGESTERSRDLVAQNRRSNAIFEEILNTNHSNLKKMLMCPDGLAKRANDHGGGDTPGFQESWVGKRKVGEL